MSIQIEIPQPLVALTNEQSHVQVDGDSVHAALRNLVAQFPALGAKIFDGERVRPYINLTVNDEDIRFLDDLATTLKPGDKIALIPAVAGG